VDALNHALTDHKIRREEQSKFAAEVDMFQRQIVLDLETASKVSRSAFDQFTNAMQRRSQEFIAGFTKTIKNVDEEVVKLGLNVAASKGVASELASNIDIAFDVLSKNSAALSTSQKQQFQATGEIATQVQQSFQQLQTQILVHIELALQSLNSQISSSDNLQQQQNTIAQNMVHLADYFNILTTQATSFSEVQLQQKETQIRMLEEMEARMAKTTVLLTNIEVMTEKISSSLSTTLPYIALVAGFGSVFSWFLNYFLWLLFSIIGLYVLYTYLGAIKSRSSYLVSLLTSKVLVLRKKKTSTATSPPLLPQVECGFPSDVEFSLEFSETGERYQGPWPEFKPMVVIKQEPEADD
jgi:hypothetical protein